MPLTDRWYHVYNLAEVAQLNNGIIWLMGKHLVLVLAAHLLIRPLKADEDTAFKGSTMLAACTNLTGSQTQTNAGCSADL